MASKRLTGMQIFATHDASLQSCETQWKRLSGGLGARIATPVFFFFLVAPLRPAPARTLVPI